MHFESIHTSNLQHFQNKINKLGPGRRQKFLMEVPGPNGRQVTESTEAINK